MPVVLPHIQEAFFPTFGTSCIPGFTGYVPKLRGQIGDTYGNATQRISSNEPGFKKFTSISNSVRGADWALPGPKHVINRAYGHPERNTYARQVADRNITKGNFYPRDGSYHNAMGYFIHDGDPRSTVSIQAVEALKAEPGRMPSWETSSLDRGSLLTTCLPTTPQPAGQIKGILKSSSSSADSPPYKRTPLKVKLESPAEKTQPVAASEKTKSTIPRRHGKIIYSINCGLLPNYSGFTPGQKFVYGKTWGRSTVNIGVGQETPFQFTSLF